MWTVARPAALVMIAFLGFALDENLGTKQMGVALATAVLVDATAVRCLLVPATVTLLARANWWAPRPLRRPYRRFGIREAPETITELVPVRTTDQLTLVPETVG